ncbi:hypothetical protein [Thermococcus radiotolerans]|uniref:Uncharacterized protein n=1 Tax=Thermococcus radiotolerans TaxID=187880 RepID=A0A2Z2NC49_9EURY|nr:hypothetical protein [Thermococcus radiotolerans]ASJ15369.1 hypothetical protein A3L10_09595 [Thermococcus radiotolerans]
MIGVVASILAGFVAGTYITLLAPLVYILALKNRDLGLVAYLIYILYLGGSVEASTLYSYSGLVTTLALSLASILLLDDVLKRKPTFGRVELLTTLFMVVGLVVPEAFLAGVMFYFLLRFRLGVGIFAFLVAMVSVFLIFRSSLDFPGSAATQALVVSAFGIFLAVSSLVWKNLKKREMFRLYRNFGH